MNNLTIVKVVRYLFAALLLLSGSIATISGTAKMREIASLRIEGYNDSEIANQLDCARSLDLQPNTGKKVFRGTIDVNGNSMFFIIIKN